MRVFDRLSSRGSLDRVSRAFAGALGGYLLIEGIWGLFDSRVFGRLPTNRLRAGIHVALGLSGLAAAARSNGRLYSAVAGLMVGTVGVLRFIPGAAEIEQRLLAVDPSVGKVNSAIGATALGLAAATSLPRFAMN